MVKWAVLGVIALVGLIYVGSVFGFRSDCIRAENGVKAQYEQNKNNYDNMWKKFREMSQVPSMYVEDMKKVWDGVMQGRYGAEGSKAMVQFIKEHNPTIDSSMYVKIQSAIEAGRNGFQAEQQQLIDKKREYENLLGSTRALFVNFWLDFPKIDLAQYAIVTSDQTEETFKNKKADEVKLR